MQIGSIFPMSPEWNYSQFRLQLILSHPNIQILSISRNPLATSFLKQKENFFKIDASIDISQEQPDSINQLKNNVKKGSVFKCGRVEQQCKFFDSLGNPKVFRILLFKIAVKDILPIYKTGVLSKDDLINFTQKYDSIYLSNKKQQLSVYDHQYMLKSATQYVWQYDIEYRYVNANEPTSKIKKWKAQNYKCQECKQKKATWFCVDQKQLFCRQCYQDTHKGRNRINHRKQIISPFNCYKKCQRAAHNSALLEYYCFYCRELKCVKCLNDAVHTGVNRSSSSSEQKSFDSKHKKRTSHEFIQIRQLIELFKRKQEQLDSQLKIKLMSKIKQVQGVISLMQSNYQQRLSILQHELFTKIKQYKSQARSQLNKAISIHLELKRKFDEILWMEKFVEYNEEILDAESNIQIKQEFASYVEFMNAGEYFKMIQRKIEDVRGLG